MKQDMENWLQRLKSGEKKKALPILSFPCATLLGVPVRELIANSGLQAEGMAAVARRTDSAAAVSLMDLSVEAECFGAQIRVSDEEVPTVVGQLIHDEQEAEQLQVPPVGAGRSGIYIDAIREAARQITDRPVLAGMIGPFSLAARLLDVTEIMIDCYEEPELVHTVLAKATEFLCAYAKCYRDAGANGILMAEPVAGLLSPAALAEFSTPYVQKIVDAVQNRNFSVIYHNCGSNTVLAMDSILSTGCAAYHFGNAVDMAAVLAAVPEDTLVMGNVDPARVLRMGTPADVRKATLDLLERCGKHRNFVVSSGCDMPPLTPWENIDAFFEAVEAYYAQV